MDVFAAHAQAVHAAAWLSSSKLLRLSLRQHLLVGFTSMPQTPPGIDFVELVVEWEEEPSC